MREEVREECFGLGRAERDLRLVGDSDLQGCRMSSQVSLSGDSSEDGEISRGRSQLEEVIQAGSI